MYVSPVNVVFDDNFFRCFLPFADGRARKVGGRRFHSSCLQCCLTSKNLEHCTFVTLNNWPVCVEYCDTTNESDLEIIDGFEARLQSEQERRQMLMVKYMTSPSL